jgi:hypothetical protein
MADLEQYRWWTVDCATDGCETTIGLLAIAPSQPPSLSRTYPVYFLKQCAPFKETCPACEKEHTYYRSDVHQTDSDPPPPGYEPSPAFLKAIEPEKPER